MNNKKKIYYIYLNIFNIIIIVLNRLANFIKKFD